MAQRRGAIGALPDARPGARCAQARCHRRRRRIARRAGGDGSNAPDPDRFPRIRRPRRRRPRAKPREAGRKRHRHVDPDRRYERQARRAAQELRPGIGRVALLVDTNLRAQYDQLSAAQQAAKTLGIELHVLRSAGPADYASAFEEAKKRAEVLIVLPSSAFNANRGRLIALADRQRLVTMWEHREFTSAGGLISYGPDFGEMYRITARKVARILEGARAAELPVEQATKLELVINRKTAKAQGVAIPQALLIRADQLID